MSTNDQGKAELSASFVNNGVRFCMDDGEKRMFAFLDFLQLANMMNYLASHMVTGAFGGEEKILH